MSDYVSQLKSVVCFLSSKWVLRMLIKQFCVKMKQDSVMCHIADICIHMYVKYIQNQLLGKVINTWDNEFFYLFLLLLFLKSSPTSMKFQDFRIFFLFNSLLPMPRTGPAQCRDLIQAKNKSMNKGSLRNFYLFLYCLVSLVRDGSFGKISRNFWEIYDNYFITPLGIFLVYHFPFLYLLIDF